MFKFIVSFFVVEFLIQVARRRSVIAWRSLKVAFSEKVSHRLCEIGSFYNENTLQYTVYMKLMWTKTFLFLFKETFGWKWNKCLWFCHLNINKSNFNPQNVFPTIKLTIILCIWSYIAMESLITKCTCLSSAQK